MFFVNYLVATNSNINTLEYQKIERQKNICIAQITTTSGIKGYIRLKYYTSSPSDIKVFPKVFDEFQNTYNIAKIISVRRDTAVVQIDGVTSQNEAEKLINRKLMVSREDFPPIQNNEFYYVDLIGLKVYSNSNEKIGEVINIANYGASDVIEIKEVDSKNTFSYPFTKEFVKSIDLENQHLVLEDIEII